MKKLYTVGYGVGNSECCMDFKIFLGKNEESIKEYIYEDMLEDLYDCSMYNEFYESYLQDYTDGCDEDGCNYENPCTECMDRAIECSNDDILHCIYISVVEESTLEDLEDFELYSDYNKEDKKAYKKALALIKK